MMRDKQEEEEKEQEDVVVAEEKEKDVCRLDSVAFLPCLVLV